jgi:rhomboid family GlyGly-CTERM serine protease
MGVSPPVKRVARLLTSLNCDGWYGLALLVLCLALMALTAAGEPWRLRLEYARGALAAGEWWRLLTAHLVHLDLRHAALNCAGLALMWALFARDYTVRQWLTILAGAAAAVDAGLWLWSSTVGWYVGSSGVLHGVMAAGTLAHLRRREPEGWVLAAFLVAKLVWEQRVGALPLSGLGAAVVVDAHLYGVAGGLAVAALFTPRARPMLNEPV